MTQRVKVLAAKLARVRSPGLRWWKAKTISLTSFVARARSLTQIEQKK